MRDSKFVKEAYNTYLIPSEEYSTKDQMQKLKGVLDYSHVVVTPWKPFIGFTNEEILKEIYRLEEVLLNCDLKEKSKEKLLQIKEKEMKAVGDRVLVKCTITEEVSMIIASGGSKIEPVVDIEYEIKSFGESCVNKDNLKVGDKVIFGEYFKPLAGKFIGKPLTIKGGKNGKDKLIKKQHQIVNYDEIVGIE